MSTTLLNNPTAAQNTHTVIYQNRSLRDTITDLMEKYYKQVELNNTTDVYNMVLAEIEEPLLTVTLRATRGNQSRAAKVLGLSRGTLRKLLKKYGMD